MMKIYGEDHWSSLKDRCRVAVKANDEAEAIVYQYAGNAMVCRKLEEKDHYLRQIDWEIANAYAKDGGIAEGLCKLQDYVQDIPTDAKLKDMYHAAYERILKPMENQIKNLKYRLIELRRKAIDDITMPGSTEIFRHIGFHPIDEDVKKLEELLYGPEVAHDEASLKAATAQVERLEALARINTERAEFAKQYSQNALNPAYKLKNLRLLRTMQACLENLWYLDTDRWGLEPDEDYRDRLIQYTNHLTEALRSFDPWCLT